MERVTEEQVLEQLLGLEPSSWPEVLDFIGDLKEREKQDRAGNVTRELTARVLAGSSIVGLWADRKELGDSLEYARRLRHKAEHRQRQPK